MGVVSFALAILQALGGQVALAALFGALGTADVISLFKFSMDRVQRSLGDQCQVVQANKGFDIELDFLVQLRSNTTNTIQDVAKINEEIRKSTLNSMELIQSFTKIAEPLDHPEPWLRVLPIRFSKLELNGVEIDKEFEVTEGVPVIFSGTVKNDSFNIVKITGIVIAVRPPGGTPDGGPFRFDFYSDFSVHKLTPFQTLRIENKKCIETNMNSKTVTEKIYPEWYRKDWCAFMTVQTADGCWNDDHNKYWFELKPANSSSKQIGVVTNPQIPVETPDQKSP